MRTGRTLVAGKFGSSQASGNTVCLPEMTGETRLWSFGCSDVCICMVSKRGGYDGHLEPG